jgi:hypothetical protein
MRPRQCQTTTSAFVLDPFSPSKEQACAHRTSQHYPG